MTISTLPTPHSDEPSTSPEQGDELRGDIEEAVAKQQIDKGNPEPYRGLKGRTDNLPGGLYEGCDEFAKLAAKNGTTLKQAVTDYHGIEKAWRVSPVRGLAQICQRTGVNPVKLAQAVLQQAQPQTQQNYQAQQYQAQQYQAQAQAQQQAEYQHHVADIEANRRSMPFFENLRPVMHRLAETGHARIVKEAYQLALKLNPMFGMSAEIARRDAVRDRQMGRGKRR
jgi:hypothetical protein